MDSRDNLKKRAREDLTYDGTDSDVDEPKRPKTKHGLEDVKAAEIELGHDEPKSVKKENGGDDVKAAKKGTGREDVDERVFEPVTYEEKRADIERWVDVVIRDAITPEDEPHQSRDYIVTESGEYRQLSHSDAVR